MTKAQKEQRVKQLVADGPVGVWRNILGDTAMNWILAVGAAGLILEIAMRVFRH